MGLLSDRPDDGDDASELELVGLEPLDGDGGDEVVYDLDDWSDHDREVLRDRLETLGVPHRWEDLSLVVAASDEAWVERILDQLEDDLAMSLDPDAERVAYDLSGWDEDTTAALLDVLDDEAIPHALEGGELFVHEIDEQRVDEVIDAILQPGDDGEDTTPASDVELMGDLFVAADRLVHDPTDHEGVLALVDALRRATPIPPYGMDKVWWNGVLEIADAIVAHLDAPLPDHDAVVEEATRLRDGLRPYF